MEPLIAEGSEVSVVRAGAEPFARNDIVTARIGNSQTPILKIIKGIPGDRLALESTGEGSFRIVVNGHTVTNSEGLPYAIGERGRRMLSLYIEDYGGVIPSDAYLLLGDNPSGSYDSSRFGLIHRRQILGKVLGGSDSR